MSTKAVKADIRALEGENRIDDYFFLLKAIIAHLDNEITFVSTDCNDIYIYDDFAHHPTAIRKSLQAIKSYAENGRIIAIMEPRSNTMRMGIHADTLSAAFADADQVFLYQAKDLKWNIAEYMNELGNRCQVFVDVDKIVESVSSEVQPQDHIVIMSNGAFGDIHQKLIERLNKL